MSQLASERPIIAGNAADGAPAALVAYGTTGALTPAPTAATCPTPLMARNEGRPGLDGPVALGRMQVGVADVARRDPDKDLTGLWARHGNLFDNERFLESPDDCRFHGLGHVTPRWVMVSRLR